MTDVRKPIFDAARIAKGAGFTQEQVDAINYALDQAGVPKAAETTGEIPADYFPMLAKIESGTRPYIKAGTSSASGLYQFIKSTWMAEGGKWGSDSGKAFGGLFPSEDEQTRRARSFTQKNADVLKARTIPINKATLYAAHFLGVGTAVKVLGADTSARADMLAGEAATKANPSILRGKTVGEFLTWLHGKTGEWAR